MKLIFIHILVWMILITGRFTESIPSGDIFDLLVSHPVVRVVFSLNHIGDTIMYYNKDPAPSPFLFRQLPTTSRLLVPTEEDLRLEEELRRRFLLDQPWVASLEKVLVYGNETNRQWARQKLQELLEAERILDMRMQNVWGPRGPAALLSVGDLLVLNQTDGVPWRIPADALTRGLLIVGRQGGGKSRLLLSLLSQLSCRQPTIPYFVLDFKQELKDWAGYLNAIYVDVSEIAIDLSPPPGLTYSQWLTALCPHIGDIIGVQYGTEILQQARMICLDTRDKFIQATGQRRELCLQDLYLAIPFVPETTSGRRLGYREALRTGLSRILSGSGDLFRCVAGINLASLFTNQNVILGCRALTDEFAVKYLAFHLLYYLYEMERFSPPTTHLKRVLVLEDSVRVLSARSGFEAAQGTSSFTEIYSVLRSSGVGVVSLNQCPHLSDPGINALSHTILCVGGIHYGEDTKLLAQMMGLDELQRAALGRLRNRQAIGISAGSAWPQIVHGTTLDVPNLPEVKTCPTNITLQP